MRLARIIRLVCLLSICLLFILLLITPVSAWKPKTHVHLAEEVIRDAQDGKITIIDQKNGQEYEYEVDQELLDEILGNLPQFRAGCIGPDGYPDLFTGQMAVHPNFSDWPDYLWALHQGTDNPAVRAFIMGYLAHASGDMFGHTLINSYAGGKWTLGENAVKHILVETYIDQQFPRVTKYNGGILKVSDDIKINQDVEDFIYQYLVKAEPGTALYNILHQQSDSRDYSLGYIFSQLKVKLERDIADYYERKREYNQDYNNAVWYEKIAIAVEKAAYMAVYGPITTYKEFWKEDIVKGLVELPETSHRIASALYQSNFSSVRDIFKEYSEKHLLSMVGSPDIVGYSLYLNEQLMKLLGIEMLLELLDINIEEQIFDYFLQKYMDLTVNDLKELSTDPEIYFASFGLQGVKNEPGLGGVEGTANYEDVPAAYNSVVMIKLLLLNQSTIRQVISDMGEENIFLQEENIILGRYLESLDDDNQWAVNEAKMVMAKNPDLFASLFKIQTGVKDLSSYVNPRLYPFDTVLTQGIWGYPLKNNKLVYLGENRIMQWNPLTGRYVICEYKDRPRKTTGTIGNSIVSSGSTLPGGVEIRTDIHLEFSPDLHFLKTESKYFELIAEGRLNNIRTGHELIYLGEDYLLDWSPASGRYTVFQYDREFQQTLQSPTVENLSSKLAEQINREITSIKSQLARGQLTDTLLPADRNIFILTSSSLPPGLTADRLLIPVILLRDWKKIRNYAEKVEIYLEQQNGTEQVIDDFIILPNSFKIGNHLYNIGYCPSLGRFSEGTYQLTARVKIKDTVNLRNSQVWNSTPVNYQVMVPGPLLNLNIAGQLPELINSELVYLEKGQLLSWKEKGSGISEYKIWNFSCYLSKTEFTLNQVGSGQLNNLRKGDQLYYLGSDYLMVEQRNQAGRSYQAWKYQRDLQQDQLFRGQPFRLLRPVLPEPVMPRPVFPHPQLPGQPVVPGQPIVPGQQETSGDNQANQPYIGETIPIGETSGQQHGTIIYFGEERVLDLHYLNMQIRYLLSKVEFRYGN